MRSGVAKLSPSKHVLTPPSSALFARTVIAKQSMSSPHITKTELRGNVTRIAVRNAVGSSKPQHLSRFIPASARTTIAQDRRRISAPGEPIDSFSSGLPCLWEPIQEPAVEMQGLIFRIIGFPEIWSAHALLVESTPGLFKHVHDSGSSSLTGGP